MCVNVYYVVLGLLIQNWILKIGRETHHRRDHISLKVLETLSPVRPGLELLIFSFYLYKINGSDFYQHRPSKRNCMSMNCILKHRQRLLWTPAEIDSISPSIFFELLDSVPIYRDGTGRYSRVINSEVARWAIYVIYMKEDIAEAGVPFSFV